MNTTEKDIELFDGYMDGTLSDTERTQFEERLKSDEAYRKAYELHSEVVLGIQRKELKAMLQEQEQKLDGDIENTPKRFKLTYLKLAIAACFFIGVCFVGYDFWKLSSLGGDYIAQLEQPVLRGIGVEETLAVIHDDLQQGNYSEAQENIDKARELVHDEQIIIHGLTEETDEEILYHRQMLKLDTDELDWYQALLYAKTHKIFKAKKLLKQIAKSDSRYSDDAAVILK
jgi:hypothetical protein